MIKHIFLSLSLLTFAVNMYSSQTANRQNQPTASMKACRILAKTSCCLVGCCCLAVPTSIALIRHSLDQYDQVTKPAPSRVSMEPFGPRNPCVFDPKFHDTVYQDGWQRRYYDKQYHWYMDEINCPEEKAANERANSLAYLLRFDNMRKRELEENKKKQVMLVSKQP